MKFKAPRFLHYIGLVLIFFLKIWYIRDQHTPPVYWPHDELLFMNWAETILEGKWLGPFNALTLTKLPGYSLWIAAMHTIGIPLLLSQQLVVLMNGILLAILLNSIEISRNRNLVAVCVYWCAPHSFSYYQFRVVRDFLCGELTVAILIISILCVTAKRLRSAIGWCVMAFGLFGFYSIIREEYFWLVPILFSLAFFVPRLRMFSQLNLKEVILRIGLLYLSLTFGFITSKVLLTSANRSSYQLPGRYLFEVNDGFLLARKSLGSIVAGNVRAYYPITREMRDLAADASPTFRPINDCLNQMANRGYTYEGAYIIGNKTDIAGSIDWAILSCAASLGQTDSYIKQQNLFSKIAQEIDLACRQKRIECRTALETLRSTFSTTLLQSFATELSIKFEDTLFPSVSPFEHYGDVAMIPFYSDLLGDHYPAREWERVQNRFSNDPVISHCIDIRRLGAAPKPWSNFVWKEINSCPSIINQEKYSSYWANYLSSHPELRNLGVTLPQHYLAFQEQAPIGGPPLLNAPVDLRLDSYNTFYASAVRVLTRTLQISMCLISLLGLTSLLLISNGQSQTTHLQKNRLGYLSVLAFVFFAIVFRNLMLSYVSAMMFVGDETNRYLLTSWSLYALFVSICSAFINLNFTALGARTISLRKCSDY